MSIWSKKILLPIADRIGLKYHISEGSNATRSHVANNIKSKNPTFLFFNGHGSSTQITGHGKEVIIELGDNEYLLKNRHVHAMACDAGAKLGSNCGAKSFIGYKFKFWLPMDRFKLMTPLDDEFALPILESALKAPEHLIKGHSPQEAFDESQKSYQEWIDEYTNSGSKYTTEELQLILPILNWNKMAQVLYI